MEFHIKSWLHKCIYFTIPLIESHLLSSYISIVYPSLLQDLHPLRGYKPNALLWTRTLDRNTRAGLPKSVLSTMSEPPSETTQSRTLAKDSYLVLWMLGYKARTLSRRRTLTNHKIIKYGHDEFCKLNYYM